jgi:hypothetical protein
MRLKPEVTEEIIRMIRVRGSGRFTVELVSLLNDIGPDVIEWCARKAENPAFIQARDTEWDEGVNYAKRLIANKLRGSCN